MAQKPAATLVLDDSDRCSESDTDGLITIDIDFNVFDEQVRGRILVSDRPAGLAEVVPVARALADKIIDHVIRHSERDGASVTCRKDCTACCRYLVPLSVPEIYRLWDEIQSFPQQRRQNILTACMDMSRKILDANLAPVTQTETPCDKEALESASDAINRWYAEIDVACPLLEAGACAIYPLRPVACREHMVTSPADYCQPTDPGRPRRLEPPFSIVEALGRLAGEMEGTGIESIMLPLAPAWREMNRNRTGRKWSAPVLFERFATIVQDLAANRSGLQPAAA